MSIQEQAATLMTDGLSFVADRPQLNVFATFAAFMEGIAREGFEFWRYQRNLNGVNEGLNVLMHFSHVGACTGRDHFSGWSLDWVNLALGYLPFLHRFYAPADARAAFIAVRDAAAHYGGHIVAIPRDTLPVLTKQGSSEPLWQADDAWSPVTQMRSQPHAKTAILALGAPAYLAASASEKATAAGVPTDVYVVNGFPLDGRLPRRPGIALHARADDRGWTDRHPGSGLRGFAGARGVVARERRRVAASLRDRRSVASRRRNRSSRSGSTSASARSTCWTSARETLARRRAHVQHVPTSSSR